MCEVCGVCGVCVCGEVGVCVVCGVCACVWGVCVCVCACLDVLCDTVYMCTIYGHEAIGLNCCTCYD